MILPLSSFSLTHKLFAIGALALLAAIAGAWGGHKITRTHYEAKESARFKAEAQEIARLNRLAYDLGQALAAETRQRQQQARAHRAEIEKWRQHGTVQVECPATAASGITLRSIAPDAVRFGADYIDLWNAGLRLGLPPPAAAGRPDAAPGRADPPTAAALLANVAENGESCNADRARLKALQAWVRALAG